MKSLLTGILAAILAIFGAHHATPLPAIPSTQASAVVLAAPLATSSPASRPPAGAQQTAGRVVAPVGLPVLRQPIASSFNGVTEDVLNARLQVLSNKLSSQLAALTATASSYVSVPAWSPSQRIDQLNGTSITNATVHGLNGLAASDIPSLAYLPSTGGIVTGLASFTNASTSLFSAFGPAYFGATATSSFDSTGALTLATPLGVGSGGTGANTFGQGWIYSNGGTGALAASTSPTVNYITATSTSATTAFAGRIQAGTSGQNTPAAFFGNIGDVGDGASGTGIVGIGAAAQPGIGLYINSGTATSTTNEFFGADFNAAKNAASAANVNAGVFGAVSNAYWQGSADSSAAAYAEGIQATAHLEGTASLDQLFGAELVARVASTGGHANTAQGVQGRVVNVGSGGTITNAYGVRGDVSGNGGITNGMGLYINSVSGVTNAYGIKVQDITGNTTLNYSLWTGLGTIHFGGPIEAAAGLPVTITATAGLGANAALQVNGGAAASGTGSINVTGGGIDFDNNQRVRFKDTGGTYRTALQGTSGDGTSFRAIGIGGMAWLDSGGTNQMQFTDSNGAWKIRNQTASTGVTRLWLQEGAGQSSSQVFGVYASDGITPRLVVQNGNVGIGTTTPWRTLGVTGTVGFDGLTGSTGAGSLCLDSNKQVVYNSGSDSCLSSLRSTKHNISPLTVEALSQILALQPVSFIYNNDASSTVRYGFIAEDAAAVDSHLATHDANGSISGIDDRAIISVLVGAIQKLASEIADMSLNIVSAHISATNIEADTLTINDQLCAKKSDGDKVCVTGDQLAAVLTQGGDTEAGQGSGASDATSSEPSTPPVLQITGDNPAIIHVGDSYADLGAVITGPQADLNLGIKTYLNGSLVSDIVLDTSEVATDTIEYVARDAAGLTAISTRTVFIQSTAASTQH